MPVDSRHPHYEKRRPYWEENRICLEGDKAVKDAGEKLLPKLGGQKRDIAKGENRYEAYKMRAQFFNATARTRDGLVGAVIRKKTRFEGVPKSIEKELETLGFGGESYQELEKYQLETSMGVGRVGFLMDSKEKDALRPYLSKYEAEAITNWKEEVVGERRVPTMIVLREERDVEGGDEFKSKKEEIYRVLKLGIPSMAGDVEVNEGLEELGTSVEELKGVADQEGNIRVYFQEIWVKARDKDNSTEKWVREKTIVPKMNGGRLMTFIPFYPFNKDTCGIEPDKGMMDDMVALNLSLYRTSADLEHGRHFTALPTAWAAGFKEDATGSYLIGSEAAWVAEDPQARAGYLEFTGQGLKSLETAEETKKKDLAVLGARLLEEPKMDAESGKAIELRHSGERSILANFVINSSNGWTKLIRDYLRWVKGDNQNLDNIFVKQNTNFVAEGMSSQMLVAMFGALQGGAMSPNVWFYNLERAEMYPEGWTFEKEMGAISAGLPMAPAQTEEGQSEEAKPAKADKQEKPQPKKKANGKAANRQKAA